MIELALDNEPGLAASRLEADLVPSYSIDTIEKLKQQLSSGDRLFFLIGADAFAEIQTWKRWRDVVNAVEFIVVSRPDIDTTYPRARAFTARHFGPARVVLGYSRAAGSR